MHKFKTSLIAAISLVSVSSVNAHHSFSPYNLEKLVEISGTLTKFSIRNPHITLELKTSDNKTWKIESMNTRRWDNAGIPRDVAAVGEKVTLLGWQAKNGSLSMVLGSVITERGKTVVRDRIRQGEGKGKKRN